MKIVSGFRTLSNQNIMNGVPANDKLIYVLQLMN